MENDLSSALAQRGFEHVDATGVENLVSRLINKEGLEIITEGPPYFEAEEITLLDDLTLLTTYLRAAKRVRKLLSSRVNSFKVQIKYKDEGNSDRNVGRLFFSRMTKNQGGNRRRNEELALIKIDSRTTVENFCEEFDEKLNGVYIAFVWRTYDDLQQVSPTRNIQSHIQKRVVRDKMLRFYTNSSKITGKIQTQFPEAYEYI